MKHVDEVPHRSTAPAVRSQITEADEESGGTPQPSALATGPPPSDDQIVARLSADLDSLARVDAFSGAARLDKTGHTLFQHAYGLAFRAQRTPNAMETASMRC